MGSRAVDDSEHFSSLFTIDSVVALDESIDCEDSSVRLSDHFKILGKLTKRRLIAFPEAGNELSLQAAQGDSQPTDRDAGVMNGGWRSGVREQVDRAT